MPNPPSPQPEGEPGTDIVRPRLDPAGPPEETGLARRTRGVHIRPILEFIDPDRCLGGDAWDKHKGCMKSSIAARWPQPLEHHDLGYTS